MKGYTYCYNHHPGLADERPLHASKGGKQGGLDPMVSEIERLKHLSASIEVNPEMLKEYRAAFKEMWSEVVGADLHSPVRYTTLWM